MPARSLAGDQDRQLKRFAKEHREADAERSRRLPKAAAYANGSRHQRFDGDDGTRPFRVSRRISEEFEHLLGLSADLYYVAELRHRATLHAS
jgi:hypothetical protein